MVALFNGKVFLDAPRDEVMKLKRAFTLCKAVISTAVSCLPDPTLGEKGVWMWDTSGIWRFVTANFLCHLGKSCPQLQFS